MSSFLNTATDAEIQAEMERRRLNAAIPVPVMVASPDFTALIEFITTGVARSVTEKFEREDFEHYVYEVAMEAVYGKGYWKWRNAQQW